MMRWASCATLALCSALPTLAAGLELRYEALERLIAQQMFTGGGRRYVNGLDHVDVTTARDSYYIRGVRRALAQSFQKDFKIDIREQARKLLAQGPENTSVTSELKDFELSGVSLTPDSVLLEVEFRLVVK